jgi:hypothetical protein
MSLVDPPFAGSAAPVEMRHRRVLARVAEIARR